MRLDPHLDQLLDILVEVVVARVLTAQATETPGQRAKLPGVVSRDPLIKDSGHGDTARKRRAAAITAT
jgi:hypothetical protein